MQLRVLTILRQWLDRHWIDWDDSASEAGKRRLRTVLQFIKSDEVDMGISHIKSAVEAIANIIRKQRIDAGRPVADGAARWGTKRPPPTLWLGAGAEPPPGATLHPLTLHPAEAARQLTLIESELLCSVKPSHLVGQAWVKARRTGRPNSVNRLVAHATTVSFWVIRTLLEPSSVEERTSVATFFLEMLRELRELNNFNGCMEVLSALQNSAVRRLKHTCAAVPEKSARVMAELDGLMSANKSYAALRRQLQLVEPPLVPFFGMYLTDITFIEDGSPDLLPLVDGGAANDDGQLFVQGMVNFGKYRLVAKTIMNIQQYQDQRYCFTVVPRLRAYLLDFPQPPRSPPLPLPAPDAAKADLEAFETALYERSLEIEPRGVADAADLPGDVGGSVLSASSARQRHQPAGGGGAAPRLPQRMPADAAPPPRPQRAASAPGAEAAPPPRPPRI